MIISFIVKLNVFFLPIDFSNREKSRLSIRLNKNHPMMHYEMNPIVDKIANYNSFSFKSVVSQ